METYFKLHLLAFMAGFLLDLIFGDPHFLYHPIRLIGNLIAFLEKRLCSDVFPQELKHTKKENIGLVKAQNDNLNNGLLKDSYRMLWKGVFLVVIVLASTFVVVSAILIGAYKYNIYLGFTIESIMTYQILALKSLRVESMKVYKELSRGTLEEARHAVSMIVGRDTKCLDDIGVAKAAIETVAENTSDGVIAPMIYVAIGGPILGFVYKAINTMDSMIGYKNDKYLYFGRAAARLDDVANYLPARISAWLMIMASCVLHIFSRRFYSGKRAAVIYKRDCRKHASPNSAQTEAVCAGALGIQLAGDASYFGVIHTKPFIGDSVRGVCYEDIKRVNALMYVTAFICFGLCCAVMIVLIRVNL